MRAPRLSRLLESKRGGRSQAGKGGSNVWWALQAQVNRPRRRDVLPALEKKTRTLWRVVGRANGNSPEGACWTCWQPVLKRRRNPTREERTTWPRKKKKRPMARPKWVRMKGPGSGSRKAPCDQGSPRWREARPRGGLDKKQLSREVRPEVLRYLAAGKKRRWLRVWEGGWRGGCLDAAKVFHPERTCSRAQA